MKTLTCLNCFATVAMAAALIQPPHAEAQRMARHPMMMHAPMMPQGLVVRRSMTSQRSNSMRRTPTSTSAGTRVSTLNRELKGNESAMRHTRSVATHAIAQKNAALAADHGARDTLALSRARLFSHNIFTDNALRRASLANGNLGRFGFPFTNNGLSSPFSSSYAYMPYSYAQQSQPGYSSMPYQYGSWNPAANPYGYGDTSGGDYSVPGPAPTDPQGSFPAGSTPSTTADPQPAATGSIALVQVKVPLALADVTFDGIKVTDTGKLRSITTPELIPGQSYNFVVAATWTQNGVPHALTRSVAVQAGQIVTVDFTN